MGVFRPPRGRHGVSATARAFARRPYCVVPVTESQMLTSRNKTFIVNAPRGRMTSIIMELQGVWATLSRALG
jgi:hypothetical protein